MGNPAKISICFAIDSSGDFKLADELKKQLRLLQKAQLITLWDEKDITPGFDWKAEIIKNLRASNLILLLISPDFMDSKYISDSDIEALLLERAKNEDGVIPVLLRHVLWNYTPFGHLHPLPADGRPVSSLTDRDKGFSEVVEAIVKAAEKFQAGAAQISSPSGDNQPGKGQSIPFKSVVGQQVDYSKTIEEKRSKGAFDVFLCHNAKDKPAVAKIGLDLLQQGILPWLDEWEMRPGTPWQRELEQQIDNIKTAAIFVGDAGIGPWQQQELEAYLRDFVSRHSHMVPVLLDTVPPGAEPALPLFLRGFAWVDFRKSEPDPFKQLIWGITGKKPTIL